MLRAFSPWMKAILAVIVLGVLAMSVAFLDIYVDMGESLPVRALRSRTIQTRIINSCEAEARRSVPTPSTLKVAVRHEPVRIASSTRLPQADDLWMYRFEVDAQNYFGAMIRVKARCAYQGREVLYSEPD